MKNILVIFVTLLVRFFNCMFFAPNTIFVQYALTIFFTANTLIINVRVIILVNIFFKLDTRFALFFFNIQFTVDYSLVARVLLFFITKF